MNREQLTRYTLDILNLVRDHFTKKFGIETSLKMFGFNPGYIIIRFRELPIISDSKNHDEILTNAKYIMEVIKYYAKNKQIEVRFIYQDATFQEDYKPYLVFYTQDFKIGDIMIGIGSKTEIKISDNLQLIASDSGMYINKEWYNFHKDHSKTDFLKS